ncbi:MAG: hypothetical protein A3C02_04250 [Candidatus Andersenbacteria bacterium RIFCSPHIGHO2_02_FULL_45_11]|uniref:Large-conductance mechanosensitive channel n=1 Tax=Candidatus Andersenbacteria bacterium RIFCSPHIGHO2_12_FULL_45_11 TaxID=1797281 RepID=A0A1G1X092_9BACT|nr:MAG: hypothetical protein A3C02_04250 [Candidatus Andersenbacteria bacterium RIFCSPHIGHO2_02_FULL_45_11]OGY33428.1 MAG: hypothetical protein A3D99_04775 [Candidatus Andersenbacteria bacterium RIFCSPHIGHO2_12_FULL_45_11]
MNEFVDEFKKFALRGNAIDLAVGVVIGAAFTGITNSLVTNIITPLMGLLMGDIDFTHLVIPLRGNVVLQYGVFVQSVIAFLITAVVLFVFVKGMNRVAHLAHLERNKKNTPTATKSPELVVLEEIRDSIKK